MPHFRKLHIKIVQSLDFNDMTSDFVRLTWALLPLACGKEGRGMYSGAWLRAKIYMLRDDITSEMLIGALDEYAALGMIILYQSGRGKYFQISRWHEYQATVKEGKSPFPAPNDNEVQTYSRPTPDLLLSKSEESFREVPKDPSIYRSISSSDSSLNLKGGVGGNGRYEGHIENAPSQELQDAITEICNVVKGENAMMPSDMLYALAASISDCKNDDMIPGFRAWWDRNGNYQGRPALKSFNLEWDNYIEGVESTAQTNEQLTPLQIKVRALEAKHNVMD